jgi:hypothetical protein
LNILIIGAAPKSLVNSRGDLIRTLIRFGHHVTAMADPTSAAEVISQIEAMGATFRADLYFLLRSIVSV